MTRNPWVIIAVLILPGSWVLAGESDWTGATNADFNNAANWSSGFPMDIGGFNTATPLSISLSANASLNEFLFNSGASGYTVTVPTALSLNLTGAGIVNNSVNSQMITDSGGSVNFSGNSTAANIQFTNDGMTADASINFLASASAGNSTIYVTNGNTNDSNLNFSGLATAAYAIITSDNGGTVNFNNNATAGNSTIANNNGGALNFFDSATAGNANIINNNGGEANWGTTSKAGSATITNNNGGSTSFFGNATADNATIINNDGGYTDFANNASAVNAVINNIATGETDFDNNSTAANATITNSNGGELVFTGTSTAGQARIINNGDVDFSAVTSGALNAGSIEGSGTFELGSNILTVGSNNLSTNVSGDISGSGGLVKVGLGTLTLSGGNDYTGLTTVQAGSLLLTGYLSGNALVASGASLSGNGSLVNLVNNGTVTPGVNGKGSLTAASYSGPGSLNINLNGSSYTSLIVTGNANVTGGTLNVAGTNLLVGPYTIVSAGTVTGSFATVNTPASAFLKFLPLYEHDAVVLVISPAATFGSAAVNPNQLAVAASLDAPNTNATSDFTTALNALALLSVPQAQAAYNQISGDSLAALLGVALDNAAQFSSLMHDRAVPGEGQMQALMTSPMELAYAGDVNGLHVMNKYSPSYGLWSRGVGFLDRVKADASLGSPATNSATGGFQAGYDFLVAENLLFGISVGYAKTSLTIDDRASSGNTSTSQSGLYASYTPGSWLFDASVSYAGISNTMSRDIVFPGITEQANASFQSRIYSSFAEGGYVFRSQGTSSLEPSLSLRESHLQQDAFTESGAPGLDLSVNNQTVDSVVSALGARLNHQFFLPSSHPLTTGLRAFWDHEYTDIDNTITAQFAEVSGGSQFTVQGTPRSRDAATLGVDARLAVCGQTQVYIDYSATLSSNETIHAILGGLSVRW